MGSLQEELARRLAESRQRINGLREQLAEVQSRLEAEEDRCSGIRRGLPASVGTCRTTHRTRETRTIPYKTPTERTFEYFQYGSAFAAELFVSIGMIPAFLRI
ncbi:hypothetical protein [Actinomadura rubrisoli]|uniref:Uncharacterized protein n=1 Tax=Actinomadura rubrisoli TaxID=2530368 RepID=A0A4R5B9P1_9ACTN|nr:hypothetical protein [Actinomadura rubrisoli]TDD82205.1 hypothetical protein E1298_23045 [Actinomadura rubrisoli]